MEIMTIALFFRLFLLLPLITQTQHQGQWIVADLMNMQNMMTLSMYY